MSETQSASHKYTPGDRVRILQPARGVESLSERFVGTLGTVRKFGSGPESIFVEPDAAPDYENSWFYPPSFLEYVGPSVKISWYAVREWQIEDDRDEGEIRRLVPVCLVRATTEAEALSAAGVSATRGSAVQLSLLDTAPTGTRISLE